jgi:hypothetical protein
MEAKEPHLRHSGDEPHGKGSAVEMSGDERHAFFIHKFSDFVSERPLSIGQERFDLKVITHLYLLPLPRCCIEKAGGCASKPLPSGFFTISDW